MNEISEKKVLADKYNSEFSYSENRSNIKISLASDNFIVFSGLKGPGS